MIKYSQGSLSNSNSGGLVAVVLVTLCVSVETVTCAVLSKTHLCLSIFKVLFLFLVSYMKLLPTDRFLLNVFCFLTVSCHIVYFT